MSFNIVNHGFFVTGKILNNNTSDYYDISDSILDVMVKKAYIEDVFPLFVIDLKTTVELRDIMRDQDVSIALRISYYNIDQDNSTENMENVEITELGEIYNGVIRIYDKPFVSTVSKIEEESEGENDQTTSMPYVYYRVSGIPEELISRNEECVNGVFKDCEVIDAAAHLITSIDNTSQLFIEESYNKEKMRQIIVPPVCLIPAIQFIDSNFFGIYKHEANIFMDANAFYLYDPKSENTPQTNTIECNIKDSASTDDSSRYMFPSIDEDNNIRLEYRSLPTFSTTKLITDHILGSDAIHYFYDENFNLISRNETENTYKKVRYFWSKLSDRTDEVLKSNSMMVISLKNLNPNLINPLTKFTLISAKYPQCAGDYSIFENNFVFSTKDMKHYTVVSNLSLLKK